jgi:hypothetical protein
MWGDWNCQEAIEEQDMLAVLTGIANLSGPPPECIEVGTNVSVVATSGDNP